MNAELTTGDMVPEFTLLADDSKKVSIRDLKGKFVVVYFYPKDDTPGCTIEAKDFTCSLGHFEQMNTVVIGISRDDIIKHQKFKTKHELKHILLADTEGEVCEKFNCWVEKSMYGKKYMGVARKTFLIDTNGIIIKIWPDVKITGHVDEVINAIKAFNIDQK